MLIQGQRSSAASAYGSPLVLSLCLYYLRVSPVAVSNEIQLNDLFQIADKGKIQLYRD